MMVRISDAAMQEINRRTAIYHGTTSKRRIKFVESAINRGLEKMNFVWRVKVVECRYTTITLDVPTPHFADKADAIVSRAIMLGAKE